MLPDRVRIVEVGPRDGLQNELTPISTEGKLQFVRKLVAAGLTQIEVTSFVNPKRVPQLADASELITELPSAENVTFSALVPNEKGLDRAIESGINRIAIFTAASETFTQKNIGMSIDESIATFAPIAKRAIDAGMSVRGYVSTCFVCPYEREISKDRVRDVTAKLFDLGVDEVAISDTIGAAVPTDVLETVSFVLEKLPVERIALHFHDTYGTALANVVAGLELGVTTFDASAGGLGGCPFAPGAAGNLATEDLVYLLDRMKIQTGLAGQPGVDLGKVIEAASVVARVLNRQLPSAQWRRLQADFAADEV